MAARRAIGLALWGAAKAHPIQQTRTLINYAKAPSASHFLTDPMMLPKSAV